MDNSIHLAERQERIRRGFPAFLILLILGILTATWVGLFSFMGTNKASNVFEAFEERNVPAISPDDIGILPNLSELSTLYSADGERLAELSLRLSDPTPLEDFPDHVVQAVLSAEDGDFYEHRGVDTQAVVRAFLENLKNDSTQGASTITQQIVRAQGYVGREVTFQRKIAEIKYATEMEKIYTKDQLLEFYLNSQYFGWNSYGMAAAGREYFGKDVSDLTIEEAAAIAVALRNPTEFDMRRNPGLVKDRRDIVIRLMVSDGFITKEEADAAIAKPVAPIPHETLIEEAPQVRIEAIRQLLNNPEFNVLGLTPEDREVAIFGCPAESNECEEQPGLKGGLIITTTVDMGLQRAANSLLRTWLPVPEDGAKAPTGAITTIDNNTGAIKVMASGLDFGTDFAAGQRDYDLATEGLRQPGSSFKPFALMAYLENGGSINSYWSSESPLKLQCSVPCGPGGSFTWTVRGGGGGLTRLFEATYRSINTVYAQVALATGPENMADMANRLGINSELPLVYSLALGAGEVTPLDMAAAYSTLARYGNRLRPHLIERIETEEGEVLYEYEIVSEQVTDPALAATVVEAMRNVTRGTAPKANIGRPMAGKTGTTQSFRDAWFVGFVPQYTSSVWVGYADEQIAMRNVEINGRTYSRVFGGDVPAPMWKEFMTILLEGVPEENFAPLPDGTSKYKVVPSTTVPSVISLSQSEATSQIYLAHLNVAIVEVNSYEAQGIVVNQVPAAGAKMTQGNAVTIEVSTGLPPEINMPDVVGLTLTQANQLLITTAETTGISVNLQPTFVETPDENAWNKIIQTQPGAGTKVATGDTVTAIIGKPPPPPPEEGG